MAPNSEIPPTMETEDSSERDKDGVNQTQTQVVVSWRKQLYYNSKKNLLLLYRRPIMMTIYIFSSAISVLLAWLKARDPKDPFEIQFDECGTVPYPFVSTYESEEIDTRKIPFSLNEEWRDGVAVAILGLGPMINAVIAFSIVHGEVSSQLLGMLRSALGVRDSVYWTSWYLQFLVLSFVNSLLGAIMTKVLPNCHAFDSIYFAGILSSLFLIQMPLIASSFFMVAVLGTARRGFSWIMILMLIVSSIPCLIPSIQSPLGMYHWESFDDRGLTQDAGLFWQYVNTVSYDRVYPFYNGTIYGVCNPEFSGENGTAAALNFIKKLKWPYNNEEQEFLDCLGIKIDELNYWDYDYNNLEAIWFQTCNNPIVSKDQGKRFKTEEERANISSDEYFVGCFTKASWSTATWSNRNKFGLSALYLLPYFHFTSIWGNFLGYTQLPNRFFNGGEAKLTSESLALRATSASSQDDYRSNYLYPQGSTVMIDEHYDDYYRLDNYYDSYLSNCPLFDNSQAKTDNICALYAANNYELCNSMKEATSGSVLELYGHLLVISLVYLLAASYWIQVFPGGNGKPQPFYYFLLKRYWFGGDAIIQEQEHDEEEESPKQKTGVAVNSVKKLYGSFEALKGVSLKMMHGEVTALLGHNGAGKTTLSHILCCETAPSEGDVHVYGYSVSEDPFAVRNLVGLCKQDDYLWPDLTANEHLELYGGLRGIPKDVLSGKVQKWLESVDLADVQHTHTATFSGGMKRRLSVALATIGDRPLIILDEPTTGMDPVSRRFVWRHIDEVKEGRVILLTTHAMEEADLLADEVAIMRKGELVAFGTPLQLKSEHGSALQFSILVEDIEKSEEIIREFFVSSSSHVDFSFGEAGNITLNIRKIAEEKATSNVDDESGVTIELLSRFVAWLESKESPVTEYGFSNSSLEEVFLKITDADNNQEEQGEVVNNNQGSRSCCSCCCYCHTLEEINNKTEEAATDAPERRKFENLASFHPKFAVSIQVPTLITDFFRRSWTGRGSIANYIIFGLLWISSALIGLNNANNGLPLSTFILPVVAVSLLLISVISQIYFERKEGLTQLMLSQGMLSESYLLATGLYGFLIQFLYGFIVFATIYAIPFFRSPYVCKDSYDENGFPDYNYDESCWDMGFGDKQKIVHPNTIFEDYDQNGNAFKIEAVREPGGFGMIFLSLLCFAFTFPGAVWCTSYIPGYKLPIVFISIILLVLGIIPSFHQLINMYSINDENDDNKCMSIADPNNVCQNFTDIQSLNDITRLDDVGEYINCIAYQISNSPMTFQSFCFEPVYALLPQYGLFQMLTMTYQSHIRFLSEPAGLVESLLVPLLEKSGVKCWGNVCKVPRAENLYLSNLMYMIIGSGILLLLGFFIASVAFLPIGPQLRKVFWNKLNNLFRKQEESYTNGIPYNEKNEEEVLPEVVREREIVRELVHPFLSTEGARENDDSSAQRIFIDHKSIPREEISPVVGYGLRKVYPGRGRKQPPKVALNNLSLHVPKGQILGFLGKNGAGKTTALKILVGSHDASGGIALVSGYDCAAERTHVFERLGNCPQFDIVWKNRSVQSHLELLARLKGLPSKNVKEISRAIADAVGLGTDAVYHRNAGALSGGMRRRLSIAMSLIGSPAVIVLDEPTTGLDPSTRSSIWSLINAFATSNDRSMIITTHMMIEADTLCNQIAIIGQGDLKVIGTQQHLKNKFGSGYLLQLNLIKSDHESQIKAMEFVKNRLHPDAILGNRHAKTIRVNLPLNLDLQKVFTALYSPESSSEGCINQFLLSQSSLEDVFVALGT